MNRTHQQAGLIRAVFAMLALALLIACSGCAEQPSIYGVDQDTVRGTCSAQGAVPVTHYSHGGWTTDCSEALSK
jgi:hypothetical protein